MLCGNKWQMDNAKSHLTGDANQENWQKVVE